MKYHKVPADISAQIKVMHQLFNIRGKKLLQHFPSISKANVYKHAKKPLGIETTDKRKNNAGRPRKVTEELQRRYENKKNTKQF